MLIVLRPNSYSRSQAGRTFINIEMAVIMIYLNSIYRSFQWPARPFRMKKETGSKQIMLLFKMLNYRRKVGGYE